MKWFKPKSLLDRTFEASIILKGLNGLIEMIGGLILLGVPPVTINRAIVMLTQSELSHDPHDLIASRLLSFTHTLTASSVIFGALYLLSHGIIKLVLVFAILRNKLWAYPWMIGFLAVFIIYQLYRIVLAPSLGLTALTIFDLFVAWLTYQEYRQHRTNQSPPPA